MCEYLKKNVDKVELARRDKQYNVIKNELYKMMKNRGMNPPEEPVSDGDDSNNGLQTVEQFKKSSSFSTRVFCVLF